MSKRKTAALWAVLAQGVGLSLGIYLAGILLLTLLLTRGTVPEGSAFPVLAALALAAALGGGILTARRTRWGTLPSALSSAGLFAALTAAAGALCWREEIAWLGQGGILLACILAGGAVAGILTGRPPRRRRKR